MDRQTMAPTVRSSDFIVERLIGLGVQHVFGVGGANIEDMFSAVQRRRPQIRVILGKHEHAAGAAADAYARLRGLGVVMTTSGGGAMNLVHAIAEARASHAPVLAIVGEPPLALQGHGAFQDTSGKAGTIDARAVFDAVTGRCFRVEHAEQLPQLLDAASDAVLGEQGPAVLLVAKDVQQAEIRCAPPAPRAREKKPSLPPSTDLERAASWLDARPIVIVAGSAIARERAQEALLLVAETLDALVATTPDGRDAFDNQHPRFLGVAGAMGHPAVARAVAQAQLVIAVGTRLPLLARQGLEQLLRAKRLVSVGHDPAYVAGAETLHLSGELSETLRALALRAGSLPSIQTPRDAPSTAASSDEPLSSARAMQIIDRLVPQGSVVLVDAGNTGATAIHHVRAPRDGRFLVAMGMAGMGWTFGAATGAALATGRRCFVLAGDGAFFMHGLDIHTAVEHSLPITYVVFNNRAHGMCLVRERLLLNENAGYNAFRSSRIGEGLFAMFPGLLAADCTTQRELEALVERSLTHDGPSVISVNLAEVDIPPFTAFQQCAPTATTVPREGIHD